MMFYSAFSCSHDDLSNVHSNEYLNYETQTNLELPFDDEWWIFWGGRNLSDNYHAARREQRFALDIVQKINGSSHSGNGSQNEDYYCFGKRLNAPGDGTIVKVINNIYDNVPGQFNSDVPTGNLVVIDHENGEFSLLAHFMEGSIIVSVGDIVLKGQELGKAGNSGNSSEPHLHYHLQNTANPFNGDGLPAQFQNYYANDIFVERGEPIQNEYVINKQNIPCLC